MRKILTTTLATLAVLSASVAVPAAASAAEPEPLTVVALGDSTASGTGAGNYHDGTEQECWRSKNTYSEVLVAELRASGRDVTLSNVTCSGATAADLAQPFKGQPPQLDALRPDTDVVTLTVGGNDIELAEYAALCIQSDCTGEPTAGIFDRMPAMGVGVFELLREIEARSPDATIVFAAYGRQLTLGENAPGVQHDPICEPGVLSSQERANGGGVLSAFNYTLDQATRLAGDHGIDVTFVSPYLDSSRLHPSFVGHSLCESRESFYRGFDALAPGQEGAEAVLHLNQAGQSALAGLIRQRVPELG